jgi:methylated-DNA-[protein]-cysteine S-methyltransferase
MTTANYAAKFSAPFAMLGVCTQNGVLTGIDFLSRRTAPLAPRDAFTREVGKQLAAYLRDPDFVFDLPLEFQATTHQAKVWDIMRQIPRGEVLTYGDIAARVGSSPRAVGRACGDNPIPIIIPCHRVVAKNGAGGFMHQSAGDALNIKHWLLRHERVAR